MKLLINNIMLSKQLISIFIVLLLVQQANSLPGIAYATCLATNCAEAALTCSGLFGWNPVAWIACMIAKASWGATFLCGAVLLSPLP